MSWGMGPNGPIEIDVSLQLGRDENMRNMSANAGAARGAKKTGLPEDTCSISS